MTLTSGYKFGKATSDMVKRLSCVCGSRTQKTFSMLDVAFKPECMVLRWILLLLVLVFGALHCGTVGWHENRNSQLLPLASPVPKDIFVVLSTPLKGVNNCVKLFMAFIDPVPSI